MRIESKVINLEEPREVLEHKADKAISIKIKTGLVDIIKSVIYRIMGHKCNMDDYVTELSDSMTKMINVTLYDNKSPLYCDSEYDIANFIYQSKEIKDEISKGFSLVKSKDHEKLIYICAKTTSVIKKIIEKEFTL